MNLYQKPPRSLAFIEQLCIIFGGPIQIIGWGFFCMSSFFIGIWGFMSEPLIKPSTDTWQTIQGVVQKIEPTRSRENRKTIYKVTSTYLYKGITYQNTAYGTHLPLSIGQSIPIKVNPQKPSQSIVTGLRTRPFSNLTLWITFPFMLLGLVIVFVTAQKNIKARNLLLYGELTRGTLKEKRATNASITINRVRYPIYEYLFEFEYMGKTYPVKNKTHKGWLVEDEAKEKILFNPAHPHESVIYDAVPVMPTIDEQGNMTLPKKYYGNLILPALGIVFFVFLVLPVFVRQLGLY